MQYAGARIIGLMRLQTFRILMPKVFKFLRQRKRFGQIFPNHICLCPRFSLALHGHIRNEEIFQNSLLSDPECYLLDPFQIFFWPIEMAQQIFFTCLLLVVPINYCAADISNFYQRLSVTIPQVTLPNLPPFSFRIPIGWGLGHWAQALTKAFLNV